MTWNGIFRFETHRIVICGPDGEQRGPYGVDEVRRLMEKGVLHSTDTAWNEEQIRWIPLSEVLFAKAAPGAASSSTQNAAVSSLGIYAGWIFLILGILTFRMSGVGFIFFMASFILSIMAMCGRQLHQVNHGIALNIFTFVATEMAICVLGM